MFEGVGGGRKERWGGGQLALQELNFMLESQYSINIFMNKSFKIKSKSISMTLTSGFLGGGCTLQKLKPVSNID